MRILLTGATGLIGRELGKALVARGDDVVCLVRDLAAARRRLPFPATCHTPGTTRSRCRRRHLQAWTRCCIWPASRWLTSAGPRRTRR
jgi:nucleoside-diphosphate-sugar epimerase